MGPRGWIVSGCWVAAIWLTGVSSVNASAWPAPVGHGEVIIKLESEAATVALDDGGAAVPIPRQALTALNLYADFGLTPRLSLQLVTGLERSWVGTRASEGLGPSTAGLRWVLAQRPGGFLSTYAGATLMPADEGIRADPSARQAGAEVRVLAGQSLQLLGRDLFSEIQVARMVGGRHVRQTRIDATLGLHLSPRLMVLNQIYAGRQEEGPPAVSWVKLDQSLVRSVGAWQVQVGWRRTLAGRAVPMASGPILGFWRRF